jgi:drug/metabolite transporter (DMT)-like permease
VRLVFGLVLAFMSAIAINWAYAAQHDAVGEMPKLSLRRPLRLLAHLARSRGWLLSFGSESAGWLLYLGALRLSPLALVQGIGASGIGVLAVVSARSRRARLSSGERAAVAAGIVGLALLAASIASSTQRDRPPATADVVIWLGGVVGGAALLVARRRAGAPVLGLAAGLLFGAGDICSKLVVFGHLWLTALVPLLATYSVGTALLQQAFQRGGALTSAGLATLATNAVPIVAGFSLFDEQLPRAAAGAIQVAAFASLVVSAVLLTRTAPAPAP